MGHQKFMRMKRHIIFWGKVPWKSVTCKIFLESNKFSEMGGNASLSQGGIDAPEYMRGAILLVRWKSYVIGSASLTSNYLTRLQLTFTNSCTKAMLLIITLWESLL